MRHTADPEKTVLQHSADKTGKRRAIVGRVDPVLPSRTVGTPGRVDPVCPSWTVGTLEYKQKMSKGTDF